MPFKTLKIPFLLLCLWLPMLAHSVQLSGKVVSGNTPIVSSTVTLYSAETYYKVVLGTNLTDKTGSFKISFTPPSNNNAVLYLIADGGMVSPPKDPTRRNVNLRLASVLGTMPIPSHVVINERTTVATAYSMAQFLNERKMAGPAPGLQNAAGMAQNLVNLTTGQIGTVLAKPPNGFLNSALRQFNSLANMVAACVHQTTDASCKSLLILATPPNGAVPNNTLQAMLNIAHFPWQNPQDLFTQSQINTLYVPGLIVAPDAWTLAIAFKGTGTELDGPGYIVVDKDGNLWVSNNYFYTPSRFINTCGGLSVLKFTPTGANFPGSPYQGGGLYGAGYGIAIDTLGFVWVSNFGFQGSKCTVPPYFGSVSEFSPGGAAISPALGYNNPFIQAPQQLVSDQQNNIWVANCGTDSVTEIATTGTPPVASSYTTFNKIGLRKPFGLAIDDQGNIWITNNGHHVNSSGSIRDRGSVTKIAPDGTPFPGSPFAGGGVIAPLGLSLDSQGNVWIANSGIVPMPCNPLVTIPSLGRGSVTALDPNGNPISPSKGFTHPGITIPWSTAVDGDDHVWVAQFAGQSLVELCGVNTLSCPTGLKTGDPISPPNTGYTFDGLQRNTAVTIDPSGNVWLTNNWLNVAIQTNPGGREIVAFIGLATPVKTPLRGLPQKP